MTASALVTIFCDSPGCPEWVYPEGYDGRTATAARRSLRGSGWTLAVKDPEGGSRLDFCPRHRPAAEGGDDQ